MTHARWRTALTRSELFSGLGEEDMKSIVAAMRPRTFRPGEALCHAGEPADHLFLIVQGFARVVLPHDPDRAVARLRRGDVAGEMSLITGEPQSATVVAAVPLEALELRRDEFAIVVGDPRLVSNLNRILSRKISKTTSRLGDADRRGEAIALLVSNTTAPLVPELVAATTAASPGRVTTVEVGGPDTVFASLDDLLDTHRTVLVPSALDGEKPAAFVDSVDRALCFAATAEDVGLVSRLLAGDAPRNHTVEVVAWSSALREAGPDVRTRAVRVVEAPIDAAPSVAPPDTIAWLGRHLARTKLGLALGAGGAKGYAHVGAIQVLEEAGYVVDAVSGSSIGAIVGAWLSLGLNGRDLEATMRDAFTPEVVADMFSLSFSGASRGLETMTRMLRETTEEKTFENVVVPLVVMAVDLNGRRPEPLTDGPLWQALLAATALAGIFPPYERDGQRLVDALALVPVPTDAVADAGADVTMSVNIISRDVLPAWPGDAPPRPEEPDRPRARVLDTLLEVMDLAQTDSSEHHAARADVVVTPRFGPSSWRDFYLADLFLEAGRAAAEEQLPALEALAQPMSALTT